MRLNRVLVSVVFAFLVSASTLPQSDRFVGEGQPETVEQALQRHHVALTKSSLVAALRSQDAEVRRLAAQKLSGDGAKDTVPSIIKALEAETVPLDQLNIAFSVAALGGEKGLATLRNTCEDTAAPGSIRMLAAQLMQNLHNDYCRDAVLDILRSDGDPDARIAALSIVPTWQHLSEDDSRMILDLVVRAMGDQASGVRMTASSTLGRLGNVSAIPFLQTALAKEQNDACRLEMGMDLQRLQKEEQHPR